MLELLKRLKDESGYIEGPVSALLWIVVFIVVLVVLFKFLGAA